MINEKPDRRKPWDAKLAERLVSPLCDLPLVHPNLFTSGRLAVGLLGAWLFSLGTANTTAALCFAFSNFLDHFDGELARMTNRTTKFGHYYDLISDFLVTAGTFFCIGVGIAAQDENSWTIIMGAITGVSIMIIFQLRNLIEESEGKDFTTQPSFFGFEAEDVLYLLPLVTIFDLLEIFLILATLGAPVAAILVAIQFINVFRGRRNNL